MCLLRSAECSFSVIVLEDPVLLIRGKLLEFEGLDVLAPSIEFLVLEMTGFDTVLVSSYCWGRWSLFTHSDGAGSLSGSTFSLASFLLKSGRRLFSSDILLLSEADLNSCPLLGWEGDPTSAITSVFPSSEGENAGGTIFDSMLQSNEPSHNVGRCVVVEAKLILLEGKISGQTASSQCDGNGIGVAVLRVLMVCVKSIPRLSLLYYQVCPPWKHRCTEKAEIRTSVFIYHVEVTTWCVILKQ